MGSGSRAEAASTRADTIPIFFNDRTVDAKPDVLKRGRVLAALVKDGRLYLPLRSVFEQMGAAVSASADGKSITAAKNGASVSVTLGKNEVVIDGQSRPLDVPPMLYKHVLFVPVRVISEALGAYVQWVPDRRLVVIRYLSAPTAPPAPPPTAMPVPLPPSATARPTAAPTAAPKQTSYGFVQAAFAAPKSYNEFSGGQWCNASYFLSAAYALKSSPFAVKADFRQDVYVTSDTLTDRIGNHYTRFATIDGGTAFTPVFRARQSTLDVRLEYQIAAPRTYVGVGYLQTANNYGYPHLSGLGVGIEKLPDLRTGVRFFGSMFYYPSAAGADYAIADPSSSNFGKTYRQRYQVVKYDVGLALVSVHLPVYLYGGFNGDHYGSKENGPIGQTHDGPYVGLGLKL